MVLDDFSSGLKKAAGRLMKKPFCQKSSNHNDMKMNIVVMKATAVKIRKDYSKCSRRSCNQLSYAPRHCKKNCFTKRSDDKKDDEIRILVETISSTKRYAAFVIHPGTSEHILNNDDGFMTLKKSVHFSLDLVVAPEK